MAEIKKFSEITGNKYEKMDGETVSITELIDKEIKFNCFKQLNIKGEDKILVQFNYINSDDDNKNWLFFTKSIPVTDKLTTYEENLPFIGKITKVKNYFTIM